jgi:branched-chain amino acid transport system substrate-binding protein
MTMISRRAALVFSATASVVMLLLAACGSTGNSAQNVSSATSTSDSSASGSPILIGGAAPLHSPIYTEPTVQTGLQAAVDAVNASGGVNGHPLKLDFCDTQYTADGELECARQFISDKVAAVLDPYFLADQTGEPEQLLAAAKIPVFAAQGVSPFELQDPDVFMLASGLPGWAYGAVDALLRAGSRNLTVMLDTNPASQFAGTLLVAAAKLAGITPRVVTGDPNSDPTFAAAAAEATRGGVNGIALFPSPPDCPKMISALRSGGYTGNLSAPTVLLSAAVIKQLGPAGNGLLADSQVALTTDTANTGIQSFTAGMQKYGDDQITDAASYAWTAVQVFVQAIAKASSFESADITAALRGVTAPVDVPSVGPWIGSGVSPLPAYPRILNPTITYGVVKNGALEPSGGGFVNPFTDLVSYAKK